MKSALITVVFMFMSALPGISQNFPYEFSVLDDPYFDLTAPISISNTDVWDDPFYITSTGFEVTIFDLVTNTLGIIQPGAQVINLNEANPDSVHLLVPYMSDIMNANDSTAVSPISYQLEGPPGNAVFKLEWKNVGFYGEWNASNSYYNTTNFQLWIYQNTGVIEFRYGPNTIKSGSLIHYFGTGPLVLLGKNAAFNGSGWEGLWALGGNPQNPTITSIPSGQQPLAAQALTGEPASGTVYRFAPIIINTSDREGNQRIHAWPSPASDFIQVSIKPNAGYSIYDISGRLMLSRVAANNREQIEVSSWPAGQYCIQSEGLPTERFIKH
jgi:hypothetical protein